MEPNDGDHLPTRRRRARSSGAGVAWTAAAGVAIVSAGPRDCGRGGPRAGV